MIHHSPFHGFPKEGVTFLRHLKRHNNREWFRENKEVYKETLEEPAKAFLEAMADKLRALSGKPMDGKIFRVYRDVRFSKDTPPYNTHVRMSFMCAVSKKKECGANPAFHFSLEPDKVTVGLGIFEFSKEVLSAYQYAVADDKTGKTLQEIVSYMGKKGFRLEGAEYKRIPPGFDAKHPREALLRRKGLSVWNDTRITKTLHEYQAVDICLKQYKAMLPLYGWLNTLS